VWPRVPRRFDAEIAGPVRGLRRSEDLKPERNAGGDGRLFVTSVFVGRLFFEELLHAPSAFKRLIATVAYSDGTEAELKYVCCDPQSLSVTAKPASERRYNTEAAEGTTKYLVFDLSTCI